MSVAKPISLLIVQQEISDCRDLAVLHGWVFSEVDEALQTFTVEMKSPVDEEKYIIEIRFDNYREMPLLIDFIDPDNKVKGIKRAYPKYEGDSFFHPNGTICNPCSRKAYSGYNNLHGDWELSAWQKNAGNLTTIKDILSAIYFRITDNAKYKGRMA